MKSILLGVLCSIALTASAQRVSVVDSKGVPLVGVKLYGILQNKNGLSPGPTGVTEKSGVYDFGAAQVRSVLAVAPAYGYGFLWIVPAATKNSITLGPPAKAVIKLVGPDGNPLSGVKLSVAGMSRGQGFSAAHISFYNMPDIAPTAVSDAQGEVKFDSLPSDASVRLQVVDERFSQLNFQDQVQTNASTVADKTLTLRPGALLEGNVTAEGKPVPHVEIIVRAANHGGGATGWTDERGHFRVSQVQKGTFSLEAELPDDICTKWTSLARLNILVPEGGHVQGMDFSLIHGALLSGTATFSDGTPYANAPVGICGPAHPADVGGNQSLQTDAWGHYSVRVPAGKNMVYIQTYVPKQSPKATVNVVVADGESISVDLQSFKLAPPKTVTGTVVDQSGKPVLDASIEYVPKESEDIPMDLSVNTDAGGHFELAVEENEFPIQLRARKGSLGTPKAITLNAPGSVQLIAKANAIPAVDGRVTNPNGKPISGAKVMLFETYGDGSNSAGSVESGTNGSFHLEGVWPDLPFSLDVRAKGYGVAQPDFEAPGSKSIDAHTIILPVGDSIIEGRVVDENGRPVSGVSVMADPYSQEPTITDANGAFRIGDIPKGKIFVRAFRGQGLVERSFQTGKDIIITFKSDPSSPTPPAAPNPPASGSKAIEIATDGWVNSRPHTLAELKGKVVVIDFWAVWCGPCNRELPFVEKLARQFAGEAVVVIGLHDSTATLKELADFAKQKGLTYPLAIDRKASDGFGITANAYGVQGIPTLVVIGKNGRIAGIPESTDAATKLVLKALKS